MQVFKLMRSGFLRQKDIAKSLGIEPGTVKHYIRKIILVSGASNRKEFLVNLKLQGFPFLR